MEIANVSKPEWGLKRICQSCACKYYDMRPVSDGSNKPILCPSCGTAFDPEALLKSRRIRTAPVVKQPKPEKVVVADKDGADDEVSKELLVDDDDESDDALLPAADPDEADDDLAEVVVKKDDEQS